MTTTHFNMKKYINDPKTQKLEMFEILEFWNKNYEMPITIFTTSVNIGQWIFFLVKCKLHFFWILTCHINNNNLRLLAICTPVYYVIQSHIYYLSLITILVNIFFIFRHTKITGVFQIDLRLCAVSTCFQQYLTIEFQRSRQQFNFKLEYSCKIIYSLQQKS